MKNIDIRQLLVVSCLALPSAALSPGWMEAAPAADLVLTGGRIYTGDADPPSVAALAIREGRVVYAGVEEGLAPFVGKKTRVIALGTRAAYPGFVDSGTSLYRRRLVRDYVDLKGTRDYDEAVRRMARAVREAPPSRWVIGWGWDQNSWVDPRFPRSQPLEAVSMGRPLALFNRELSAVVLNRGGMEQAAIDQETPDPPGGRLLRLRGNPIGCLVDRALDEIWNVLPGLSLAEVTANYRAAADSAARQGWTGVHEVGLRGNGLTALTELARASGRNRLPIRIHGVVDVASLGDPMAVASGPPVTRPDSRVRIRGLRWVLDGGFSTRCAAISEPYADEVGNTGTLAYETGDLERGIDVAIRSGWQPVFDASGEVAVEQALGALDSVWTGLAAERPEAPRPRILRGTMIRPADLDRLARLGVSVTVYPGLLPDQMRWIENRLGMKRMTGVNAWKTLVDKPVPVCFGTNAPGGPDDPLALFHAAVTRQDQRAFPRAGWYPDERLSRGEALAGLTGGAALSGRDDDGAGTLTVGRVADITVLSADIMTVPEPDILSARAVMTIVDGEVVWERR